MTILQKIGVIILRTISKDRDVIHLYDKNWPPTRRHADIHIVGNGRFHELVSIVNEMSKFNFAEIREPFVSHTPSKIVTKDHIIYKNRIASMLSSYRSAEYFIRIYGGRRIINFSPTPENSVSECYLINHPFVNNYFHWTTEVLPVILSIQETEKPISILSKKNSRFILEFIDLFKDRNIDVLQQDATIERAVFPPPSVYTVWSERHPHLMAFKAEKMRNLAAMVRSRIPTVFEPGRRVFIDRSKAGSRAVENIHELDPVLAAYGFEKYVLEDLPWQVQVDLFRSAEIIVAPHGAGMANMLFCDPGATIIELFPRNRPWETTQQFAQLSHIFGLRHFIIECEPVGSRKGMRVDASAVAEILRSI